MVDSYHGGITQMTTSALGLTNQSCYELSGGMWQFGRDSIRMLYSQACVHSSGCFDTYGFEYASGNDGWITWISSGEASWTAMAAGMAGDPTVNVSQRPVPEEPLYCMWLGSFRLL